MLMGNLFVGLLYSQFSDSDLQNFESECVVIGSTINDQSFMGGQELQIIGCANDVDSYYICPVIQYIPVVFHDVIGIDNDGNILTTSISTPTNLANEILEYCNFLLSGGGEMGQESYFRFVFPEISTTSLQQGQPIIHEYEMFEYSSITQLSELGQYNYNAENYLNVYFVDMGVHNTLNSCSLAWGICDFNNRLLVVRTSMLDCGGTAFQFEPHTPRDKEDIANTLVHEFGHLMGLLHTIYVLQEFCDTDIDCISDTPNYFGNVSDVDESTECTVQVLPEHYCNIDDPTTYLPIDKNMMGSGGFYRNQDPCRSVFTQNQIKRMHMNYDYNDFFLDTGYNFSGYNDLVYITSGLHVTEAIKFNHPLIILDGGEVTIDAGVHVDMDSHFIVIKDGGKLILESGSKLLSTNVDGWPGILVFNDTNSEKGSGTIIVHGGIENAKIAIFAGSIAEYESLCANSEPVLTPILFDCYFDTQSLEGGLVTIEGTPQSRSLFTGNQRDIYVNYSGVTTDCCPIYRPIYISYSDFYATSANNNIFVKFCPDFRMEHSSNNSIENVDNFGMFLGLTNYKLIGNLFKAENEGQNLTVVGQYDNFNPKLITDNLFISQSNCAYLVTADNIQINENEFILPLSNVLDNRYGVYLVAGENYSISSNKFYGSQSSIQLTDSSTEPMSYGIISAISNGTCRIEQNGFYGTDVAIQAQEGNSGLEMHCNSFGNTVDEDGNIDKIAPHRFAAIAVTSGDIKNGVCSGFPQSRYISGNTFSYDTDLNCEYCFDLWFSPIDANPGNLDAATGAPIVYTFPVGDIEGYRLSPNLAKVMAPGNDSSTGSNVNNNIVECELDFFTSLGCGGYINGLVAGGGGYGQNSDIYNCATANCSNYKDDIENILFFISELKNKIADLENIRDGYGRKADLINLINDPTKTQYQVKSVLDTVSYITDEVLIEYINRYPYINSPNLRSVLIRQSPLSKYVAQALIDREVPITLNSYNMIADAQDNVPVTDKFFALYKESEDSYSKLADGERMYSECLRQCDEETALIAAIAILPVKDAKEELIHIHTSKGEFQAARAVLEEIDQPEVEGKAEVKAAYKKLTEVNLSLMETNREPKDLTQAETEKLMTVSESKTCEGIKAKMLLAEKDGYTYFHPIEKPDLSGIGKRNLSFEKERISEEAIYVFPNPASGVVSIELPAIMSGTYEIIDLTGKILETDKFENRYLLSVSMEKYFTGLYSIKIRTDDSTYFAKISKK